MESLENLPGLTKIEHNAGNLIFNMNNSFDVSKLHTNQRLLVEELIRRGAEIEPIDTNIELLNVTYNGQQDFLLDRFSSISPFHVVKLSADKWRTKKLLSSRKISVPHGELFNGTQIEQAVQYALSLNRPMVLKPNWGSHGDYVKTNLKTRDQVSGAIWQFIAELGPQEPFILETFHDWSEHRLFATKTGGFAVIHREPASVLGDGVSDIKTLIINENNKRRVYRESNPSSACEIIIDSEVQRYLYEYGLSLETIPKVDQKIYLRHTSNLAKGGKAIDETEIAHASIKNLASDILSVFPNIACVGIDLLCADIKKELNDDDYVIIEVNSNPGLAMHVYPTIGKSRPVFKDMANVMFPWIPSKE